MVKSKDEQVTITFALNKVLSDRLHKFLKKSGLSQSSVIREALDLYLRSKVGDNN